MSIVSSTHVVDAHEQADGSKWVLEKHTDDIGAVHTAQYLAPEGTDYVALRTARAARIAEAFADSEYQVKSRVVAALNLRWQTNGEFAARFRAEYKDAVRERVHELSWWAVEMVNAGHLTDAQLRNAFNMTVNQYNTFKTDKLVPRHDRWADVISAAGE